jgi:hypothetical protein
MELQEVPCKTFRPLAAVRSRPQTSRHDLPSLRSRLSRDNTWSVAYAARVLAEYERFLPLAARVSHRVVPRMRSTKRGTSKCCIPGNTECSVSACSVAPSITTASAFASAASSDASSVAPTWLGGGTEYCPV